MSSRAFSEPPIRSRRQSPTGDLWRTVDDLLDRASAEGILYHGLGALGAKRLRSLGAPVPEGLQREERSASLFAAVAGPLLRRVRQSCDGPLIVFKGPEVAGLYPPGGRAFSDLDLLTPRADAVQRSLLAAGFRVDETGAVATYHLQPLFWPTLPLQVEVHGSLKWPGGLTAPDPAEILEASIPSSLGIDGVSAPAPAHHALVLAAHSWEHRPLRIFRDLLDIALVSDAAGPREIEQTAASWGLGPIWRTTHGAIEAMFDGGRTTVPLRTWARHINCVRDRTVLESHLEHWMSPFWGLPIHLALPSILRVLREEVGPLAGESWRDKLRRSMAAASHPNMTLGGHDESLGRKL